MGDRGRSNSQAGGSWGFITRTVPSVSGFLSTVASKWIQDEEERRDAQRDQELQGEIQGQIARISELLKEQEQSKPDEGVRNFDVEVKQQLGRIQHLLAEAKERKHIAEMKASPGLEKLQRLNESRGSPGLNISVDSPAPSISSAENSARKSSRRHLESPVVVQNSPAVSGEPGLSSTIPSPMPPPSDGIGYRRLESEDLKKLFSKARHNKYKEVDEVLNSGVHYDVRDEFGNTLMMVAAQNGHKRIVKSCLRRGANINAQNFRGQTALHYCYAFGYAELGQYLESKGADVGIRNEYGLDCYEGLEASESRLDLPSSTEWRTDGGPEPRQLFHQHHMVEPRDLERRSRSSKPKKQRKREKSRDDDDDDTVSQTSTTSGVSTATSISYDSRATSPPPNRGHYDARHPPRREEIKDVDEIEEQARKLEMLAQSLRMMSNSQKGSARNSEVGSVRDFGNGDQYSRSRSRSDDEDEQIRAGSSLRTGSGGGDAVEDTSSDQWHRERSMSLQQQYTQHQASVAQNTIGRPPLSGQAPHSVHGNGQYLGAAAQGRPQAPQAMPPPGLPRHNSVPMPLSRQNSDSMIHQQPPYNQSRQCQEQQPVQNRIPLQSPPVPQAPPTGMPPAVQKLAQSLSIANEDDGDPLAQTYPPQRNSPAPGQNRPKGVTPVFIPTPPRIPPPPHVSGMPYRWLHGESSHAALQILSASKANSPQIPRPSPSQSSPAQVSPVQTPQFSPLPSSSSSRDAQNLVWDAASRQPSGSLSGTEIGPDSHPAVRDRETVAAAQDALAPLEQLHGVEATRSGIQHLAFTSSGAVEQGRSGSTARSGAMASDEHSEESPFDSEKEGIVEPDLHVEAYEGEEGDDYEEEEDQEEEQEEDEEEGLDLDKEEITEDTAEEELLQRLRALENEEMELDIIHNQLKAVVQQNRVSMSPEAAEPAQSSEFLDDLASARLTARAEDRQEAPSAEKPMVSASSNLGPGAEVHQA